MTLSLFQVCVVAALCCGIGFFAGLGASVIWAIRAMDPRDWDDR